jgi:hypothetical protein
VSTATFESLNYGLRPAKNVERKMLCEAMARLSRIASLRSYRYVGFGATGFHDFVLIHQRLGIRDMTSIEGYLDARDRVEFNRPYSCIKMRWGLSYDLLPAFKWTRRAIVWLDYDKPLDARMLGDITVAISSMRSGSLLVVTVTADPGPVDNVQNVAHTRLERLRSRVGRANIRADVTGADLSKWGLAKVSRDVIHDRIEKTLSDRNGPAEPDERINYEQLFHFHYADGAKMLTVGGLLTNGRDGKKLNSKHFGDLDFIRTTSSVDPYLIDSPVLTLREIRYLDERLPRLAKSANYPKWLPESDRRKYAKIYRYFPNFSEVEA